MTAAVRDATIAARVPLDLRQDLELLAARRDTDLTHVIRWAVRELVDRELHGMPDSLARRLFGPRQGTTRRHDHATSNAAARDVAPRTGSQRRRALAHIVAAGEHGATTDEVIAVLERTASVLSRRPPAVNGVARRVTDLLEAGAIEEARCNGTCHHERCDGSHVLTRKTRHGSDAIVWVATDKGRSWLQENTG